MPSAQYLYALCEMIRVSFFNTPSLCAYLFHHSDGVGSVFSIIGVKLRWTVQPVHYLFPFKKGRRNRAAHNKVA